MTNDEIDQIAAELVQEWIKAGPDLDYVQDYLDGGVDARSLMCIQDRATAIAAALKVGVGE